MPDINSASRGSSPLAAPTSHPAAAYPLPINAPELDVSGCVAPTLPTVPALSLPMLTERSCEEKDGAGGTGWKQGMRRGAQRTGCGDGGRALGMQGMGQECQRGHGVNSECSAGCGAQCTGCGGEGWPLGMGHRHKMRGTECSGWGIGAHACGIRRRVRGAKGGDKARGVRCMRKVWGTETGPWPWGGATTK